MEFFLYNFSFLWFNTFLALIAVLFGYLMLLAKSKIFKVIYGFLWFIFLPNTIYILTDLIHLYEDWPKVDLLFKIVLTFQYGLFAIAGVLTFIYGMYFFEKLLEKKNKKRRKPSTFLLIFILNFIVGFGVILGAVQRTNSWYIFTDPLRVINDSLEILSSYKLWYTSIIFGIFSNIIYFYFVKSVTNWGKTRLKK